MIRNLFASLVVVLALGSASAVLAQEIVPATHSHGGPVVSEGSCAGGSCSTGCCSNCVRVPKTIDEFEYCSKCKEKCGPRCTIWGFLTGNCGGCETGDCQQYTVRRLYKKAVQVDAGTKCVHVSELPAARRHAVVMSHTGHHAGSGSRSRSRTRCRAFAELQLRESIAATDTPARRSLAFEEPVTESAWGSWKASELARISVRQTEAGTAVSLDASFERAIRKALA